MRKRTAILVSILVVAGAIAGCSETKGPGRNYTNNTPPSAYPVTGTTGQAGADASSSS